MAPADLTVMSRMRKEIVYRESKSKMRALDPSEMRASHGMETVPIDIVGNKVLLQGMRDVRLNGKEARVRKILKNGHVLLIRAGEKFTAKPENLKVCELSGGEHLGHRVSHVFNSSFSRLLII